MAELGPAGVPVLGVLAAGQPDGAGPANPARAGLLPPAGRRAARARHRAVADALPLGPAAGAGGRRRLAGPGHRRPVRRLRRAGRTARSATGCALDHAQRAVVLGVPRLRLRRARARAAASRRPPSRAAHHLLLGHGLAAQALRAAGREPQVGHHAQPVRRSPRGRTPPADADAAAARSTGCSNRFFLDPVLRGALPGRRARRPRAR